MLIYISIVPGLYQLVVLLMMINITLKSMSCSICGFFYGYEH